MDIKFNALEDDMSSDKTIYKVTTDFIFTDEDNDSEIIKENTYFTKASDWYFENCFVDTKGRIRDFSDYLGYLQKTNLERS